MAILIKNFFEKKKEHSSDQIVTTMSEVPPLNVDFLTKLKQIIIAIPNSEILLKGRYDEILKTQSFEELLLKLVSATKCFIDSNQVDNETKFNVFFSYHYYVDLLCESMTDAFVL